MSLSNYAAAEILATCNALGSDLRGVYQKSSDCLSCLKDLILYLKRDDEEHSVLRQLGELRVLQNDLLPILKRYSRDQEIFDMTLRLLVILTHPAFLLYNEEIPEDKLVSNIYLSLVSYLQSYKKAFTDVSIWKELSAKLKQLLMVSYIERDEDDRVAVERILILIRNVLHIPADETDEKRTDDDVSVHDQVLWALHLSGLDDLILYLSQSEDESQYCMHVLEIILLMHREQKAEVLANAGQQRSAVEKEEDERKLNSARRKEQEKKLERVRKLGSQRFSGVYYVKNMKSISDREHISHKLLSDLNTVKFDDERAEKRTPKNRLPVPDVEFSRRSTLSICLFLKQFCSDFVSNSYNVLMATVKRCLVRKSTGDHDDSYYLWAISYFMEFNRRSNFRIDVVSETISVQTFHYIQTQMDNYYEMLLADKKKAKFWSRRMHLGLKAYKELLETLKAMDQAGTEDFKKCADVIKSNVFYVVEYRELLLTLFGNFDPVRFSRLYLVNLVQTTHLFLKMLDQYGKSHSRLIVQKKKKRRKQAKRKKRSHKPNIPSETELHDKWYHDISSGLSATLQGRKAVNNEVVVFDAASDVSFEDQKKEVVFKIRDTLVDDKPGDAVGLLRAARALWPEGDEFGAQDIEPEDEFLIHREIFFANLPVRESTVPEDEDDNENEDIELEVENEEMEILDTSEQNLNLSDFFNRFASPKVVQPCCQLLETYKTNSAATNVSLLKLMHRIAWDCKMHGLFYQASLFLVFQKIVHDSDRNHDPVIKELSRFAKFILEKFFETAQTNRKVLLEMLFWKNTKDVFEIENGYNSFQKTTTRSVWTEEEEQELKDIYDRYKELVSTGTDIGQLMMENLSKIRTRKEIAAKLKQLGLINGIRDLKPKHSVPADVGDM